MMLLLLHLTMGSSDFVCAKHGPESTMTMPAASAHMVHHQNTSHGPQDVEGSEGGKRSIPQNPCCSAMASCSVSVAATPTADSSPRRVRRVVPPSTSHYALSRVVAPETPPPRA